VNKIAEENVDKNALKTKPHHPDNGSFSRGG
jgi:hypothetical protein